MGEGEPGRGEPIGLESLPGDALAGEDAIGIMVLDADGEITYENPAASRILGTTRAGSKPTGSGGARFGFTDADGRPLPEGEGPYERVTATREPVENMVVGTRGPDGERVWLQVNTAPVDLGDGGVVVAFRDVTEQRRIEAEFEEILGRVTDAFVALDEAFRFTHVNQRATQLLDRQAEALVGERLWDVFPEAADIDALWTGLHEALAEQKPRSCELFLSPLDAWIEANVYPSPTGVSVYFRDITQRKTRERDLEQARELTRAVNDAIITIDADTRIQSANPAVEDIFGYPPEELVGERLTLVMPDELADRHLRGIRRYLRTGERDLDWSHVELPGRRRDGSEVPLAISFSEFEHNGDRYFTGVIRDDTERKHLEDQLRAREERFRQIAEHINEVFWMTPPDKSEMLYVSPAYEDVWGRTRDSLYERPLSFIEAIHPEDRDRVQDVLEEQVSGEYDEAYRVVRPDGSVRWVRDRAFPITDDDGEVYRVVGIAEDITERKHLEQELRGTVRELEESNQRLEEFAYAASHDLQEPLRMISSYLQLIDDRYATELDADGREFLEFAVDGADRMRLMIEDLLAYSRIDTEAGEFEPTDCGVVVERVLADLSVRIEESGATIEVQEPLPTVVGDPNQVEQVFRNLVSNALKYNGKEAPNVMISAEPTGRFWEFAVTDEGIGIDPSQYDRVFEVFTRLDADAGSEGTGIGLALCRRVVERHGGEIWVEAEPGVGASFYFTLLRPPD